VSGPIASASTLTDAPRRIAAGVGIARKPSPPSREHNMRAHRPAGIAARSMITRQSCAAHRRKSSSSGHPSAGSSHPSAQPPTQRQRRIAVAGYKAPWPLRLNGSRTILQQANTARTPPAHLHAGIRKTRLSAGFLARDFAKWPKQRQPVLPSSRPQRCHFTTRFPSPQRACDRKPFFDRA